MRAYVFRTSDGTEFVGFLERYTQFGKRAADAAWNDALSGKSDENATDPSLAGGVKELEVKRPGQPTWTSANSPEADVIFKVVGPNGQTEGLKLFDPE